MPEMRRRSGSCGAQRRDSYRLLDSCEALLRATWDNCDNPKSSWSSCRGGKLLLITWRVRGIDAGAWHSAAAPPDRCLPESRGQVQGPMAEQTTALRQYR